MITTFLNDEEICALTGRKIKSLQITALRSMGIPYFVNATGHPVVTRSAIEGKKEKEEPKKWAPNVLRKAA